MVVRSNIVSHHNTIHIVNIPEYIIEQYGQNLSFFLYLAIYVNDDGDDGGASGIDKNVEELEEVLELVKLEQNIQGLKSANARKRRQSHMNITSLLVDKNT